MNITFFVILLSYAVGMVFLKNLLNLNMKGYRAYVWQLIGWAFFIAICVAISENGVNRLLPHLSYLHLPVLIWMTPLFYFMLMQRPRKSYNIDLPVWRHRLPAIFSLIALMPWLILTTPEKLTLVSDKPIVVTILELTWMVMASGYSIILIRRISRMSDNRVYPIVGWFVFIAAYLITLVLSANSGTLLLSGIIIFKASISYYIWSNDHQEKRKSVVNALPDIDDFLAEHKVYLDVSLTSHKLAEHLGLSVAQLSKSLNQPPYQSYSHYINRLRVDHAIGLLQAAINNKYTLEALAHQSGFKSLTTFNAAFKKHTGKTPKQYRVLTES